MIGGGLAGLASAVTLAEQGFRVRLLESRPHLGGRATSYWLPDGSHVDNCQHVTMACCTNLGDFYRRVGAEKKIGWYRRLYFADRAGRRGEVGPSFLMPPGHLAPSFLGFPGLSFRDKRVIASALLRIARRGGELDDMDGRSMLEWLRRHDQTEPAIERFWRTVLVSALNEELLRTDARYGVQVFWKGFLANRRGFELGIPSVPLAELYDGCAQAIAARGGEISLRSAVRRIAVSEGRVSLVELSDGRCEQADYVVSSVPHHALVELLPKEIVDAAPMLSGLQNLKGSPITGVHLWYDRQVMSEPFLTLLDTTTQWVFNKTLLYGGGGHAPAAAPGAGQHLQLVISASYDLVEKSRTEVIETCSAELREVLPAAAAAQLVKSAVIKEVNATFSPEPGCDRWRPPQRTSIAGLVLAGDWTATGWPATMEGAVRSGYLAAQEILRAEGRETPLLLPDLQAEGLSGFWAAA